MSFNTAWQIALQIRLDTESFSRLSLDAGACFAMGITTIQPAKEPKLLLKGKIWLLVMTDS